MNEPEKPIVVTTADVKPEPTDPPKPFDQVATCGIASTLKVGTTPKE